ncbi:MAG: hypothetical protein N2513_06880 [Deltaproteobacteria bacterium]|nr:hypothetical protein [Deltaproteobacteria bacterium]
MSKRKISFSIVCFLVFWFLLTSDSMGALVSSKFTPPLEPGIPMILITDTTKDGFFAYDAQDKTFELVSQAIVILLSSPKPFYTLTGQKYSTSAAVNIDFNSGTLQGGIYIGNLGTLTIEVETGSVKVGSNTYSTGTTLLSGTVWAFGFYDADGGKTAIFDFQIKDLKGKLVDDGFWPSAPNTTSYLYAWSENAWPGNFNNDFRVEKSKGKLGPTDSPPVPLPTSVVLLGSGLSVFGLLRVKSRKRK